MAKPGKNLTGYIATLILFVLAAFGIAAGLTDDNGQTVIVGLMSGSGLIIFGQVKKYPFRKRTTANWGVGVAMVLIVLPVLGLFTVGETSFRQVIGLFACALLLPLLLYLLIMPFILARRTPGFWRQ